MTRHDPPTFDADGYPTEETLKIIKDWPFEEREKVLSYIAKAWHYPESAKEVRPGIWVFATGGWSGNESIIAALRSGVLWYLLSWDSLYLPGGLLIIAVGKSGKDEMERLRRYITKWAWKGRRT